MPAGTSRSLLPQSFPVLRSFGFRAFGTPNGFIAVHLHTVKLRLQLGDPSLQLGDEGSRGWVEGH
jgi:hypothetical protein